MSRLVNRLSAAISARWRCQRALATARADTIANLATTEAGRVLVVCYGNICRSPFAAACLVRASDGRLEVRSSGFHPRAERTSPERHFAMSRRYGVDLSGHRSNVIDPDDLEWADLIVFMDRHNWQDLYRMGAPAERLVWLGALDGGPVEITDPYAMDESSAEQVLQRLQACTNRLACLLRPKAEASAWTASAP